METLVKTDQKINLVEGVFSPSETMDVVMALLNEKINFHKLQRISWCEGSIEADTKYPDERIAELENEQEILKEFVSEVRHLGKKLRISGTLNIEVVDL